ncbi:hypothetical protein TNIN_476711 [Trichonephila inaurata madagascariensis]|uniref:Uncharacterized protein n=1 Tax=Trichonephila inaurata madagascariensis TaxID=2747483 RepID=A0A8X6J676_9ARAC|nr:hypothetical protein TNIN_476711 [Trichonephila inaurata madagascariensis]
MPFLLCVSNHTGIKNHPHSFFTKVMKTILLSDNENDIDRIGHLILPLSDPNAIPYLGSSDPQGKCESLELTVVRIMRPLVRRYDRNRVSC